MSVVKSDIQSGQTTANVTISGYLDYINVTNNPVNFTLGARNPGNTYPKSNGPNYITIKMGANNNIIWDAYMNASDLIPVGGIGGNMQPNLLTVSSDCDGGTALPNTTLNYGLIKICSNIGYERFINVTFYLTVPVGRYNNTYNGNLWVYVNSSASTITGDNRTWPGPGNTTITIGTNIEFSFDGNTVPITFPTMSPGTSSNASTPGLCGGLPTCGGFPTNMTLGANTNVLTDIYFKGTDLIGLSGQALGPPIYNISIGPYGNLTYSNATNVKYWSNGTRYLNYSFQVPVPGVYQGDFPNWYKIQNNTNVTSFWNISIPGGINGAKQGSYGGNVIAQAFLSGKNPYT
jgi:hypothetical protein